MGTVEISGNEIEGSDAADRLANDWHNRGWVPLDPSLEWARSAVGRLGEIIAAQPSMVRSSIRGAGKGASTLSPRPFQGLVECLQNADDLGAASLRVAYEKTMKDPDYLGTIDKMKLDAEPATGARIEELIAELYKTPKEAITAAAAAIK